MFRLHRQNRPPRSGERIDFKFSNFQAIQVPKGWDKLFVTVLSIETGKTIAKSSKAPVRNGNCQWTETLAESIWISQDSIKVLEERLFKFVVAMGSARSGILGEATVNMAGYLSSKASVPVLLPLEKCNYGTILQVKIHCITPRTKLRDGESKDSSSHAEEQNADHHDMEIKSNESDDSFVRNAESPSSNDLGSTSHPGELQSRETSFSASGSHDSFDSAEGSIGRENFPQRNNLDGDTYNLVGRQDSISSLNSTSHGNYPAEDAFRSNHPSFNSRVTGLGNGAWNHWQESAHSSSQVIASSPLMNAGSSKNLLEAAEHTIEELRAEAKMWERNARKLMLDLDILRKEFSDQSKKQADLDMELSAAYTERDSLKKEVKQLKLVLGESRVKQTSKEDSTFQSEGAIHMQKELETEIKFQQESNASLALQLNRSQESNIELVTVLQELEETIEKQKVEIESLSALQSKISDMENSIQEKLEENRNLSLQLQQLQESENKLQVNLKLLEQALENKRNLTEKDCSRNQTLHEIEAEYRSKLSSKEKEIASLEAKLSKSLVNRQSDESGSTYESKVDLIREIESLTEKLQELERDCSELTNENLELLFKLKDYKNNCMGRCKSFDYSSSELADESFATSEVSELKSEIHDLQKGLKNTVIKKDQLASLESHKVFPDLVEQLQMAFYHVKKAWYNIPSYVNNVFEPDLVNLLNFKNTDTTAPTVWADSILSSIIGLNNLLDARIVQCEEVLKCGELEMKERNDDVAEAQKKLEDYILKENNLSLFIQKLESSNIDMEASLSALEKELNEKRLAIEKLETNMLLKEEEIGFLRQCQWELEAQISDLKKEKVQLEENMKIMLRESNITSKCLGDLRNDLMVLSSGVDSHVSANKILERKCSELESQKNELEPHLLNLEKENVQMSERTSGSEAQLQNTSDEIRRLRIEMEREKLDLTHKTQDMQNDRSDAQECENLKIANQKLQVSADCLIEECNTLQKENGQLRKLIMELHENCTHMETKLSESQNNSSDHSKRVEALEANVSAMLEAFAVKEKTITSEIDALIQENRNQKEKLVLLESLLNQTYSEKTAEVESLQREIEQLTKQISATHDEKERIASEAVHEVSSLHSSKAKLESALQEVQSKVKLTEKELDTVRTESELKVQGLLVELSATRQNHELLVADHEKMLKLLGSYKSSEEKLKTILNDLELKLTVSEYERQQLIEETANLKVQLQMVTHLQDEILALKSELNASKFEKEKVEISIHSVSRDCEELKAEKIAFIQKISSLQTAMSEFEECKHKKDVLEEKLQQMESDLSAREALCVQDAELKNELSRITTANKEFQRKIQQLEDEKGQCLKKAQSLEEQLKLMEEYKKDQRQSRSKKGDNKHDFHDESPRASGVDHIAKVQLLEDELAQALEANNKYKTQLQRFLSDGRNNHAAALKKSTAEGDVVAKERYERTKSSLETELRDLRDRYFHMSLKYAEVEAQREDLVMKLKAAKNGKKWFS